MMWRSSVLFRSRCAHDHQRLATMNLKRKMVCITARLPTSVKVVHFDHGGWGRKSSLEEKSAYQQPRSRPASRAVRARRTSLSPVPPPRATLDMQARVARDGDDQHANTMLFTTPE
jgi:hypothetical protein